MIKDKPCFTTTQQPDGRYYAEYHRKGDLPLTGIGQFGKTAFEAEINLQALINAVRRQMLQTNIIKWGYVND